MHTIEVLREAIALLERCGYSVRHEWLDGGGSGACQVRGKKWFFVDLALSPEEQLDRAVEALRSESEAPRFPMPYALRERLKVRKSA